MMKKLLILLILMLISTSPVYAFSDVSENAWYAPVVAEMAEVGYINGYDDDTFKPEETITYAEFITIVKRCAAGSADSASYGHWADKTMEYAYNNHWYDYDEISRDMYDAPIPRYMAAKITAIGLNLPENEHDGNKYWEYMNSIKDFNAINGRYAYLVVRCYCNSVLTGDDKGNFNPESNLTRAEASAIILRAVSEHTPQQTTVPIILPEKTARSGGVGENGWLQLNGTQLCNERGEEIVLHGMSSHGLHWFPEFTSREYIKMTADSGANVFRAAMYTAEGGYISQPETVFNLLTTAVENAIAEDVYVIIDWHILSDGNPMTYIEQSKLFFDKVSARYADVPNVIYEICNEPNGNVSWDGDIKPYAEQIIPIIRANSPGSLILVGSSTWSQDIDKPADNPLEYENIMYTCHFYAGTHGQWLRDRIAYTLSKGAPIFVSEWGTSAADGNGGVFQDESEEWLEFLEQRGISWCSWSLCNKNESSAALTGDGSLSESGKIVFEHF